MMNFYNTIYVMATFNCGKFNQGLRSEPNFSDQFKKIVKRYIRVGYNLDIMRQSACLV